VPQKITTSFPDLRLLPIALAAWTGAWLATSGHPVYLMVGAGLLIGCLIGAAVRRSWWTAATSLMLAGAMIIGLGHQRAVEQSAVSRLAAAHAVGSAQMITKETPTVHSSDGPRPPYAYLDARVTQISGRGQSWTENVAVLVTVSGANVARWKKLPVGSTVRSGVRLEPARHGSDIAAMLRAIGPPRRMAPPKPGTRLINRVHRGLRQAVHYGRAPQRAFIPAMVLGDKDTISAATAADFKTTSLTHLMVVSGMNLTLLLAFLMIAARWVGVRGWWLRLVGLAGVVVFVPLCRGEPSVLRAAAMGLVSLAALGMSDRSSGLRGLFVASIGLVLLDPWLCRSVGFALSVLATGGIVWWSGRWTAAMVRWLPRIVAEAIAVPLAAHLATLPVITAISGRVSVVGVLTNAVAAPLVAPARLLGFVAAAVSLVSSWVAGMVGWAACWAGQPILWVAHYGAALPGAAWNWPVGPASLGVLGVACLGLGLIMPAILGSRWLAAGLVGVMLFGVLRAPAQPGWPPKDWLLVACDIGQGDGLVVHTGKHAAIVVDSGPDPVPMKTCLDQLHVTRVPLLMFSHFHADHVGGLAGVLAGRSVDRVWLSPYPSPPDEAATVRQTLDQHQIPDSIPPVGTKVTVGAAHVSVLGPRDRAPIPILAEHGQSSLVNNLSILAMITVDGERILFTGDLEPEEQQRLLDSGADLHADVLKVPHHGSSRQDPAFIAATHARVAIASAGQHNDYGHPAPHTMHLLRSDRMTALCTCRRGSIAVTATGHRLGVVSQHKPHR
jgi:competence protein ComEC